MKTNTDSAWYKASGFKKRINGWITYQISSWVSLFFPEAIDRIMYKALKEQFDD